jgi:alcohol dehydrogenase (cytochrome c)
MRIIKKLGAAALVVIGVRAQQQSTTTGPFTAEQATAGRAAYQAHCASCHLPDLSGRNEALPLAGSNFMNTWGTRSTRDLFAHIRTMPPGKAESLGQQTYLEIAAYILETNGAVAGGQELTASTAVPIRSVASGEVRGRPQTFGPGDYVSTPRTGLRGITVAGEVKNYVPVTDQMLIHPDPNDWLMIRRNYQAWSYSPLTQI